MKALISTCALSAILIACGPSGTNSNVKDLDDDISDAMQDARSQKCTFDIKTIENNTASIEIDHKRLPTKDAFDLASYHELPNPKPVKDTFSLKIPNMVFSNPDIGFTIKNVFSQTNPNESTKVKNNETTFTYNLSEDMLNVSVKIYYSDIDVSPSLRTVS